MCFLRCLSHKGTLNGGFWLPPLGSSSRSLPLNPSLLHPSRSPRPLPLSVPLCSFLWVSHSHECPYEVSDWRSEHGVLTTGPQNKKQKFTSGVHCPPTLFCIGISSSCPAALESLDGGRGNSSLQEQQRDMPKGTRGCPRTEWGHTSPTSPLPPHCPKIDRPSSPTLLSRE